MAMSMNTSLWLGVGIVLLFIATPVSAFGAGDIVDVANIDGVNYRHGDIENTLLELIMAAGSSQKFEKLDVKRVYFGNWLRDYSQAIDVGGLKQLPSETIRILLWCLSFLTFGYATGEFEVTAERLGCYRPEEHIDNPKDYADNEDARKYDQRLRAPVNEGLELKVNPETGLKTYIASEGAGCDTSAGLIRKLFEKSIELGRKHKRENNKADLYEALRLLGTGLHCLEDYAAHSNYTELALRELGVDAFPHVGKNTEIDVRGKKIFPIVTGTFGMTDFLHSVVGELGDKVAQSEVEDMENKLTQAEDDGDKNTSVLKEILDKVPWDILEGDSKPDPSKADELKQAANQKAEEEKQHPLDPNASLGGVNIEQAKQQAQQTLKDMYPILEFHDQVMKGVTTITSKVPGLDELLENMSGALQIFIFSLLAPYVKPIIAQARVELKSTSEGVLKSSAKGQYEVFENDSSTDPTHSMLSKDHFSNVLNPVAGQIACATVKFVVPHIVDSWSDEGKDVRQTIDDILQVFHHPALRDENRQGQKAMFETVKKWWEGKDDSEKQHLKDILSRDGIKDGKNHEGEGADGGHSHGAPPKKKQDDGFVPSAQEGAGFLSQITGGLTDLALEKTGLDKKLGTTESSGQRQDNRREDNESSSYGRQNESQQETSSGGYGQQSNTQSYGGNNNESSGYGQSQGGNSSSRYGQESTETSSYGGNSGRQEETSSYGRQGRDEETSSYGRTSGQEETSSYSRTQDQETSSYGRQGRDEETSSYGRNQGREETSSYGQEETSSYGRTQGSNEESSYSGRQSGNESSYGQTSSGYGSRNDDNESSERRGGNSYGQESNEYGSSGRQESSGYGGDEQSGGNEYGSSGRGDSGGYGGGEDEGGSRRQHRRDDNENENSRY